MSQATKPTGGYGDVDWVDLSNNWFANDAEWLQSRSVVRVAGDTPTTTEVPTANNSVGRVFFSNSAQSLIINLTGGYHRVASSANLSIKDGSPTSQIKATAAADGTGITINNSTGAVTIGALTLSSTLAVTGNTTISGYLTSLKAGSAGSVSTSASGLIVNTSGSNAVTVTTSTAVGSATTLEISNPVRVTGSINTTAGANITGTTALTGGLTVSGTSALAVTTVSSTLGVTGATTAAAITASGVVTANGTIVVGGTSPSVLSATGKDLLLNAASSQAIRTTSSFYYGSSGTTTKNAWVIYQSSGTPTVGDYPEGTIWIS